MITVTEGRGPCRITNRVDSKESTQFIFHQRQPAGPLTHVKNRQKYNVKNRRNTMSKIAQKIRQPSFLPGSGTFLLHTGTALAATGVCSSPRSRQDSLLRRPSSRRRPAVPARRYTPPAPETGYRHNKHKKVIHTRYFLSPVDSAPLSKIDPISGCTRVPGDHAPPATMASPDTRLSRNTTPEPPRTYTRIRSPLLSPFLSSSSPSSRSGQ